MSCSWDTREKSPVSRISAVTALVVFFLINKEIPIHASKLFKHRWNRFARISLLPYIFHRQMFPFGSETEILFPFVSETIIRILACFRMFSNVSECSEMFPNVFICFQCFRMFPNVSECFHLFPIDSISHFRFSWNQKVGTNVLPKTCCRPTSGMEEGEKKSGSGLV